jgi:hypothetical protein
MADAGRYREWWTSSNAATTRTTRRLTAETLETGFVVTVVVTPGIQAEA